LQGCFKDEGDALVFSFAAYDILLGIDKKDENMRRKKKCQKSFPSK
jgi:hypothetical protein